LLRIQVGKKKFDGSDKKKKKRRRRKRKKRKDKRRKKRRCGHHGIGGKEKKNKPERKGKSIQSSAFINKPTAWVWNAMTPRAGVRVKGAGEKKRLRKKNEKASQPISKDKTAIP